MEKISLLRIGIHPITDGRRMGVCESLEEQAVNMAKATAVLVTERLRHACGVQIEYMIVDTCIADMTKSAARKEKFNSQNVGVTIIVTPCWCYGSETTDMDPMRSKAIWGFSDTERPGAAYLTAVLAAYSQGSLPALSIYGHGVQDADNTFIPADVGEKLLCFAHASLAVAGTKGESYLSVGGVSMGIAGPIADRSSFESWLEMKVQAVDMTELRHRIDQEVYDETELGMALTWADKSFRYGEDRNAQQYKRSARQSHAVLKKGLLMIMYIRDMMQGNKKLVDKGLAEESLDYNVIAAGFQGRRHWTGQYPNGDTAEALLNSPLDWNNVREPFVIAIENDSLDGVAMPFGHQLTDMAQVFADVRTYWSPEAVERVTDKPLTGSAEHGIIHLINSGSVTLDGPRKQRDSEDKPAMRPHREISQEEAGRCLAVTEWCPIIHEYFRGDGYLSRFLTEGGVPFTMSRANIIKGPGPVLQIVEGWSVESLKDMHDQFNARIDSAWPTIWLTPRLTGRGPFNDIYSVMANWDVNHGVPTIGHVGVGSITLAAILHIPVCMHNAEDEKVCRPSPWATYGMDAEGQDYRACQNYGPLYKR